MFKKAQAAMEFLMTYGWAILVVLAAIAALAYFGVLSPDRFLPEKCTMPSGVACLDFTMVGSDVTLVMQNAAGFDMTSANIAITGDCTASTSGAITLINGAKANFVATCSESFTSGQKLKAAIALTYTRTDSGLNHTSTGELIIKAP